MSVFPPGIQIAIVLGFLVIFWTVALTARRYTALPNRLTYPRNYGDGGEMNLPRTVVWLAPAFQIVIAGLVGLRISFGPSHTHGEPLTALIIIDLVLFALFSVQRGVMLRPDRP